MYYRTGFKIFQNNFDKDSSALSRENGILDDFISLGNNIMGNIHRLDIQSVSYGDKDLQMKQQIKKSIIKEGRRTKDKR